MLQEQIVTEASELSFIKDLLVHLMYSNQTKHFHLGFGQRIDLRFYVIAGLQQRDRIDKQNYFLISATDQHLLLLNVS